MKHTMKLQEEYFNRIKNGTKTIEFRLYDEKRRKIQVGDIIEFKNSSHSESLQVLVIRLHKANSFDQLFHQLIEAGYGVIENSALMETFYSIEQQRKYGVLGIEIKGVNG